MKVKYAAHLIMAVRFREGRQDRFPCYENVVLVYANSDEEAMQKAREYGEAEAEAGETFDWNERPAYWEFVGVRKLIECRTPGSQDDKIGPGTEVTYSLLVLPSEEDLRRLADGEPVTVTYQE
jgi:hypothetical protein